MTRLGPLAFIHTVMPVSNEAQAGGGPCGPPCQIHAAKLRREGRGRPMWAHLLVSMPLDRPLARRWQGVNHLGPPCYLPQLS